MNDSRHRKNIFHSPRTLLEKERLIVVEEAYRSLETNPTPKEKIMKRSLKFASLAALTAATLALPAAAADMPAAAKCQPKVETARCGAKCASKCAPQRHMKKARCGASKCAPRCGPKCGAKCAPKCAPKN